MILIAKETVFPPEIASFVSRSTKGKKWQVLPFPGNEVL